jgi:hypothetical protein
MKIAHIKENLRKTAPFQITNHLQQRKPIESNPRCQSHLSPLDNAQEPNVSSRNKTTAKRQMKNNNQNRRKILEKQKKYDEIKNSPHNNWSLHNHFPRKIRNIIPEAPTQNVPTLPQNSTPLIRQHRRHSYKI